MYDYIFFDLDGTLTDSAPGIMNSVEYALGKFGIRVADRRSLNPFIGPPLVDSFKRYYGFSEEEANQALLGYREYFTKQGMFENAVYPGIPELLDRLLAAGKKLVVATAKPEEFSVTILKHFGLADRFLLIAGASMDETRNTKDAVIRYALERCGDPPRERVLMVGDRQNDAEGAAAAGIDCLGVLYGYGSEEELRNAGVRLLAETPEAVGNVILTA